MRSKQRHGGWRAAERCEQKITGKTCGRSVNVSRRSASLRLRYRQTEVPFGQNQDFSSVLRGQGCTLPALGTVLAGMQSAHLLWGGFGSVCQNCLSVFSLFDPEASLLGICPKDTFSEFQNNTYTRYFSVGYCSVYGSVCCRSSLEKTPPSDRGTRTCSSSCRPSNSGALCSRTKG